MAWTPADIQTALWFDALDASTIETDLSGKVSKWSDKSGNGRHATQTTENLRPTLDSDSTAMPFILFSGTYLTALGTTSDFIFLHYEQGSVYLVAEFISDNQAIYAFGNGGYTGGKTGIFGGRDDRYDGVIEGGRSVTSIGITGGEPSDRQIVARHFDGPVNGNPAFAEYINKALPDRSLILGYHFNAEAASGAEKAAVSLFGGVKEGNNTDSGNISPGPASNDFELGAGGGGITGAVGSVSIREFIVVAGELSEENANNITGYLAHKWNLSGSLPISHPYRALPPGEGGEGPSQSSKVSGVVQIDGAPARRTVRAFGYNPTLYQLDGENVIQSKSLGQATSDGTTGEYTIDLLKGYDKEVFVVAFDDYGADFAPETTLAVGDRVHPTTPNGHVFECTGAGTLPATEPAWMVDTEAAQLYGTASMIARPFYRPMVHGPVMPEVTILDPVP